MFVNSDGVSSPWLENATAIAPGERDLSRSVARGTGPVRLEIVAAIQPTIRSWRNLRHLEEGLLSRMTRAGPS